MNAVCNLIANSYILILIFIQLEIYLNIPILLCILVALLSSPPTNIRGTVQQTSVMLTWTQSDIDAVQNYIISYTRTAGCSDAPSRSQTISGSMSMYTLSGLQENTTYDITITAMNTRNRLSATESFTTLTASMLYLLHTHFHQYIYKLWMYTLFKYL